MLYLSSNREYRALACFISFRSSSSAGGTADTSASFALTLVAAALREGLFKRSMRLCMFVWKETLSGRILSKGHRLMMRAQCFRASCKN